MRDLVVAAQGSLPPKLRVASSREHLILSPSLRHYATRRRTQQQATMKRSALFPRWRDVDPARQALSCPNQPLPRRPGSLRSAVPPGPHFGNMGWGSQAMDFLDADWCAGIGPSLPGPAMESRPWPAEHLILALGAPLPSSLALSFLPSCFFQTAPSPGKNWHLIA